MRRFLLTATFALTALFAAAPLHAGYPVFQRRISLPQPPGAEECGMSIKGMGTDPAGTQAYVADGGWTRILKLNAAGEVVLEFGTYGTGAGQFERLRDVCAGPDGSIYATDSSRHRVLKFSSSGQFIMEWGGYGADTGFFNSPGEIQCHADGRVFVADTYNGRIQIFNPSGQLLSTKLMPAGSSGAIPSASLFTISGDTFITLDSIGQVREWTTAAPHPIALDQRFGYSGYSRPARQVDILDGRALALTPDGVDMGFSIPFGNSTGTIPQFAVNDGTSYRDAMAVLSNRTCFVSNSNWCAVDLYRFGTPLNAQDPAWIFEPPSTLTAVIGQPFTVTAEATGTGPLTYEWGAMVPEPLPLTGYAFEHMSTVYTEPSFTFPTFRAEHSGWTYAVIVRGPFGYLQKQFVINGVTSAEPIIIKSAAMNSARTHFQIVAGRVQNTAPLLQSEISRMVLQQSTDMQTWVNTPHSPQAVTAGAMFTFTVQPLVNQRVYWRVKY